MFPAARSLIQCLVPPVDWLQYTLQVAAVEEVAVRDSASGKSRLPVSIGRLLETNGTLVDWQEEESCQAIPLTFRNHMKPMCVSIYFYPTLSLRISKKREREVDFGCADRVTMVNHFHAQCRGGERTYIHIVPFLHECRFRVLFCLINSRHGEKTSSKYVRWIRLTVKVAEP